MGKIVLSRPRAAEFFAGIGLVRAALQDSGFAVVFANDIESSKRDLYAANFGHEDFVHDDVRNVQGDDIPDIELATASFPCTDLSLAGNRAGISGDESSMFWQFTRVLREMGDRRPPVCMLENVPSFATSRGGDDLRAAVAELNRLGYSCDLFVVDARRFVPQSRPRLFIVGARRPLTTENEWAGELRPPWIARFVADHPELQMHALPLRMSPNEVATLRSVVERLHPRDRRWWDAERVARFRSTLSPIQSDRVDQLIRGRRLSWATAYRRTRYGCAVWEVRADEISGCLRTARGGSSKQALVEAGRGRVRVRWMTPREYARLQGTPDFNLDGATENQALFGLGDAVCVPVVAWIAREYLHPLVAREVAAERRAAVA